MGTCGIPFSELFDPISESWVNKANMNLARYYPSNLILPNGLSLTLSGFDAAGTALVRPTEVWDPSSGFVANMNGPSFRSGEGAILLPGLQKVLVAGGQAIPTRLRGLNSAIGLRTAQIIDLSSPNPKWVYTGSMSYGRHDLNLILLPNGTALAVGGAQAASLYGNPAKHAELYNPATRKWTVPAAQQAQRGNHSTALLLPDARVISAGSDFGPLETTVEIFSPPYLFHGIRPSISAAPGSLRYGQGFTIHTPNAANIAKVVLIGADVTTHADHFEQRFVGLTFTAGSGQLAATAPSSSSEAPAGYYMLFIVNSTGVTSVAKLVQVQWITEHQALRVNRDLLALEGQFLDHLFRLILPQDVVRSGVMRMISASSAIISGRRRIRNQVRLPTDHDIPELRPVLVEFVDQSATRGTSRMFCKRTSRSSGTRLGFRSTAEYKALPS